MFDDMIAGMQSNKKLSLIVTELILRGKNTIFHFTIFPITSLLHITILFQST